MFARLIKATGWVVIGTALGQAIVLITTPYLARKYSPLDFGAFALLTTVSNLAVSAACLRFDLALPSASRHSDSHRLLVLCLACSAVSAVAAALTLLALSVVAPTRLVSPFTAPWIVALCVALVGAYQATASWFVGQSAYRALGMLRCSQGAAFTLLAVLPSVGLLWSHALSFVGGLIGVGLAARQPSKGPAAGLVATAREFRQFPLVSLPGAIFDALGVSVCVWTISAAYGLDAAGEYAQVQRLIGAPLMLLSMSVAQVLLRQTAEVADRSGDLNRVIVPALRLLVGIAIAGLVLVGLFGEPLLKLILGPKWRVDQSFVLLIALSVFTRACISPLSSALVTLRRLDVGLRWQIGYFLSSIALLPLLAFHQPLGVFLVFFVVHELAQYGLYLWVIQRAIAG